MDGQVTFDNYVSLKHTTFLKNILDCNCNELYTTSFEPQRHKVDQLTATVSFLTNTDIETLYEICYVQ